MIFNRVYEMNWNTIGLHFLPRAFRYPKFYAWFKALFKPSETLHTKFMNFRRDSNYKIDHTPQVFSLEKVLNDAFDQQQRRIYIREGVYIEGLYFYNPDENSPVHFYNESEPEEPPRFYNESELEQLDVDFVVVLPSSLFQQHSFIAQQPGFSIESSQNVNSWKDSPKYLRIVSLIDTYRLPDKTYQIVLE